MASYLDQFSEESILVIKQPPVSAPTIQPITIAGEENFLEERFISFAYRYKYQDGEYSATSQFSEPSFIPNSFDFSFNSYLNEGMTNSTNASIITFNSGGPLVVGIDLLFKEANNSVIKVIEKLDKSNLGYANNQNYTFTFSNSKIFTILPVSEILRAYDNVPLFAQAQTVMGNRLIYGNYIEGYDLIDTNKAPVRFEYTANLKTEEVGNETLNTYTQSGVYSGAFSGTIPNSVVVFDLVGVELIAGASVTLDLTIEHNTWTGVAPYPTETTSDVNLTFTYIFPTSYNSVYELATSTDFIERMGTVLNIQTVANSCNGETFTDQFNCELPLNLGSSTKSASGISATGQPLAIISTPGSTEIGVQMLSMVYVDTLSYNEYYSINFSKAEYQRIANPTSLHSNRGYEIGIIYMDNFNRSSTALVSPNNTVSIPCSNSATKNSIQVTIPTTQRAPSWATRYKFCIKPDEDTYETIYSNVYFEDPGSNAAYFLLEGESAAKVTDGDRLIVKSDINGPTQNCVYTTVLEKEVQAEGFLIIPTGALDQQSPPQPINVFVPSGPYMKLNPNNFSIITDTSSGGPFVVPGPRKDTAKGRGNKPLVNYPVNILNPGGTGTSEYIDYTIPAGARIKIEITQKRTGRGSCDSRSNVFKADFVSTETYPNFEAWWTGDNISTFLIDDSITSPSNYTNVVLASTSGNGDPTVANITTSDLINYYRFYTNTATGQTFFMATGPSACASSSGSGSRAKSRQATTTVNIEVVRFSSTITFETIPTDALPDIWYENNLSLEIGGNGGHTGNVQSQNFSTFQPAIINTEFYNCYAFGNGVESYKIRDSISGKQFNLGNRATSTSAIDYKQADRVSDLTYSGVFNDETNVNKLNEFNLGLLNFKPLEESFGSIQKLFARETDILTLQEDKVSYVLRGKNLLSDAAGTSTLTSVPEVLGLQIARIEDYGISFNPESFSSFGPDKFFTDSKRGALIQLKGSNYQNEQLLVISEAGMRGWFRDLFIDGFATQKLGGYDPYMNEFVLGSNCIALPVQDVTENCGVTVEYNLLVVGSNKTFTVELGNTIGIVTISWTSGFITPGSSYGITAVYDGVTYNSPANTAAGTLTFDKNNITKTTATITIGANVANVSNVNLTVSCPAAPQITVRTIVVTSDNNANALITRYYGYSSGTYSGPLISQQIAFITGNSVPLVSSYVSTTGAQGTASIPVNGATVQLGVVKKPNDDYVFNVAQDKFGYLRSTFNYQNNPASIAGLINDITTAGQFLTTDSSLAPSKYFGTFTMPNNTDEYLYLVYDLRSSTQLQMCYSPTSASDACCGC